MKRTELKIDGKINQEPKKQPLCWERGTEVGRGGGWGYYRKMGGRWAWGGGGTQNVRDGSKSVSHSAWGAHY